MESSAFECEFCDEVFPMKIPLITNSDKNILIYNYRIYETDTDRIILCNDCYKTMIRQCKFCNLQYVKKDHEIICKPCFNKVIDIWYSINNDIKDKSKRFTVSQILSRCNMCRYCLANPNDKEENCIAYDKNLCIKHELYLKDIMCTNCNCRKIIDKDKNLCELCLRLPRCIFINCSTIVNNSNNICSKHKTIKCTYRLCPNPKEVNNIYCSDHLTKCYKCEKIITLTSNITNSVPNFCEECIEDGWIPVQQYNRIKNCEWCRKIYNPPNRCSCHQSCLKCKIFFPVGNYRGAKPICLGCRDHYLSELL